MFNRGYKEDTASKNLTYNEHQIQRILHLMNFKAWQVADFVSLMFSGREYIDKSTLFEKLPSLLSTTSHSIANSSLDNSAIHGLILDAEVACSIHDRQKPIIILLGGTSGCGKSTIASFLSSRFGISSILSTDSARHVLRTKHDKNDMPHLWTSSYQVVDVITSDTSSDGNIKNHKECVVQGYQLQSDLVAQEIDKVIRWYALVKKESLIIEGVHLSMEHCTKWMHEYESVIPFMLFIEKDAKHMERFAIRAKYMTLEPHINKYIRYFDNIRIIQNRLSDQAEIFGIPKIDNTNVDRTIAILHQTIFAVLKLHLSHKNTSEVLVREFNKIYAKCMGSKEALSIIRQRGARKRSSSETNISSKQVSTRSGKVNKYCLSPQMRSSSSIDDTNNHQSTLLTRHRQKEVLSSFTDHKYTRQQLELSPFTMEDLPEEYEIDHVQFSHHYNDNIVQGNSPALDDDEIASLGS